MADRRAAAEQLDNLVATSGKSSKQANGTDKGVKPARQTWSGALRKNWRLYSLLALPTLYFIVFRYLPMAGNVIAFRKFRPGGSIFGEYWVGFQYIDMFIHCLLYTSDAADDL